MQATKQRLIPQDQLALLIDAHHPVTLWAAATLRPELDPVLLALRTGVAFGRPTLGYVPGALGNEHVDQGSAIMTAKGPLDACHSDLGASAEQLGISAGLTFVR